MRHIDLQNERDFENRKASGEPIRSKQSKFYWATSIATDLHMKNTLNAIAGTTVLEIGCASGHDAVEYSRQTKNYIGVDISDVAIHNCKKLLLKNATFYCVDGHELPVEDASVDYVIVNSLLHHLDLEVSFKEISRVLTDNGALIFREPLGTNPVFQLYRALTPSARTVDERPFTFNDLKLMQKYFELGVSTQWFGFLSIFSAFVRFNRVRRALTAIDLAFSKSPLKYFYWQFSGIAYKK